MTVQELHDALAKLIEFGSGHKPVKAAFYPTGFELTEGRTAAWLEGARMTYPLIRALRKEAAEWNDPGIYNGYKPNDQDHMIPHYYVDGWREALTPEQKEERAAGIIEWEDAHGHDTRGKCYPEYGCQALEGYSHYLVSELISALDLLLPADN